MNNEKSTPKVWKHAKDYTSSDGSFAVRITACVLEPKYDGAVPLTHFTWELVRFYDDKAARHIPFACTVSDGTAHVQPFASEELSNLLRQAEEWVRTQRQEREDLITKRRLQPKGLKELSKQDAKKYPQKE